MYKFRPLALLVLLVSVLQITNAQFYRPRIVMKDTTPHKVHVRYEPAPGCPQKMKFNTGDTTLLIQNKYVEMKDSCLLRLRNRLERASNEAFRYEITPDNSASYYRINTFAKKMSVGIYANYLMPTSKPDKGNWIQEDFAPQWDGLDLKLRDFEIGVVAGRQLFAKGRNILGVELAAAYRGIIHLSSINHYETTYDATDPDGDDYERLITVSDYHEKTFTHGIVIPIALRYDWFAHKKVSLFATAGLENDFLFSQKTNAQFNARYAGVYRDDFFNITIDQNGIYDFGVFQNLNIDHSGKHFQYYLYGTLSLGIQVFIGKTVSIEAAGLYAHQLANNKAAIENGNFVLTSAADNVQSITNVFSPSSMNRLGVNVTVKMNF